MNWKYYILLFALLVPILSFAQNEKKKAAKVMKELYKTLEEELPDDSLALNYEKTAKEQVELNQYEKAEKLYDKAKALYQKLKNKEKQAAVERELSAIYFKSGKRDKGFEALQQSYELAMGASLTMEAQKSVDLLAKHYLKVNDSRKALAVYADFIERLDTLIQTDSSLVDRKLYI